MDSGLNSARKVRFDTDEMDDYIPANNEEIREAFILFDRDGDGFIETRELGTIMRSLGRTPTEDQVRKMAREIDPQGTGRMDFDNFMYVMVRSLHDHGVKNEMREAFRLFDTDNDGYISVQELRHIMTNLGEKLTDEEVNDMIKAVDRNGDGKIDLDKFTTMMSTIY